MHPIIQATQPLPGSILAGRRGGLGGGDGRRSSGSSVPVRSGGRRTASAGHSVPHARGVRKCWHTLRELRSAPTIASIVSTLLLPYPTYQRPLRAPQAHLSHAVPHHPGARPAGPRRRRQGPGDPGAAPPTGRAAPPGSTSKVRTRRPCPAGGAQPRAATGPVVLLPGQARDAAALAPPPGRRRVDLPASRTWASAARRAPAAVDRPPCRREFPLGLPEDQG